MFACSGTPVLVDGGHSFTQVAAAIRHTCALHTSGDAYCWGNNWYGQLGVGSAGGDGGIADSYVPVAVLGDIKFD